MDRKEIKGLYYITHIDNLDSILQKGICSHHYIEEHNIPYTPVYDKNIVNHRKDRKTPTGKSLWEYANLYFQPRNPMLYRVIHEKGVKEIVILALRENIIDLEGICFSDGNAAHNVTEIFASTPEALRRVEKKAINSEWWTQEDGLKRKIMAECLIPERIEPEAIHSIYVADHATKEIVEGKIGADKINVIPEARMFFQPNRRRRITSNLSLVSGDMFFSTMQTLTVSVNTVGVMGKGLASRTKYQFPDVYVHYQDACRNHGLRMGKPYLYKRALPLDEQLADDPATLKEPNSAKWFLLFATKGHWRETSNPEGIEQGLLWIQKNYQRKKIQSLAIPALGCGLGKLRWQEIGPLMTRYLAELPIPVCIYLPREEQIPDDFLQPGFLLPAVKA